MDHEGAIRNQAVERYLLGELTAIEREEFEAHYFSCRSCAGDVREASMFAENAREVLRELRHQATAALRARQERFRGWVQWLEPRSLAPAFAMVAMAVALGYQQLVTIAGLRESSAPRVEVTTLLAPGARSADSVPVITVGPGQKGVSLALEVNLTAPRLAVELRGPGGDLRYAAETGAGRQVMLWLPTGLFTDGIHEVLVRAVQDPADADRYRFRIQHQ